MSSTFKSVVLYSICFTLGLSLFFSIHEEKMTYRDPAAFGGKVFFLFHRARRGKLRGRCAASLTAIVQRTKRRKCADCQITHGGALWSMASSMSVSLK